MKKLLTLFVTLVALVTFSGMALAEEMAKPTEKPAAAAEKTPAKKMKKMKKMKKEEMKETAKPAAPAAPATPATPPPAK